MPLRAFIENIEKISTYLMSNEWIELKDRIKQDSLDVIISQTDKKGYLRTSKNGLQYFVHKKEKFQATIRLNLHNYFLLKVRFC